MQEYPVNVTLTNPRKLKSEKIHLLIGDLPTKYNFVLWIIKELMVIYKYDFEHENAQDMFMIFKGSYGFILFLLENCEVLCCKDTIFYVIYHSLSF